MLLNTSKINKDKEKIYNSLEILVAINYRYYETPGEHNIVIFKLAKIINKKI